MHAYERSHGFSTNKPIRSVFDGYNRSLLKGRTIEDGAKVPRRKDKSPAVLDPVKLSEEKRQKSLGELIKLPRDRVM